MTATVPHTPRVHRDGDGLMKAFGSRDSMSIRVLSPRIEPPVLDDDGSTACMRGIATMHTQTVARLPACEKHALLASFSKCLSLMAHPQSAMAL